MISEPAKKTAGSIQETTISIIIVTYNAAAFLRACLLSIKRQTFTNFEVLIFDGGSSDQTLRIIQDFADMITFWKSEPDKGIYDAMNKAVKHASGNWLLFLGADDKLLNGFSQMAEKLVDPQTIYYGYCLMAQRQSNKELSEYYVAKLNVCHQAVFYPKIVFEKYSYNTAYRVYADHALNIRCWGDRNLTKKFYPFAIADYNLTGFSHEANDEAFERDQPALIRRYSSMFVYWRFALKKWKARLKK